MSIYLSLSEPMGLRTTGKEGEASWPNLGRASLDIDKYHQDVAVADSTPPPAKKPPKIHMTIEKRNNHLNEDVSPAY